MSDATSPSPSRQPPNEVIFSGFKIFSIMVGVCLVFAIVGLDSTVIATAVPTMTSYFGTIDDIGWYTSVYQVSAKPIILWSLVTFLIGSLLCALAPSSPVFIVGRGIAGLATAGVVSGGFAIIITITPLQKRPTYAGIGAAIEATASLVAPLIGGVLTTRLSWRWCFFTELPLIALAITIVVVFLRLPRNEYESWSNFLVVLRQLDLTGTAMLISALTSLILALQWGGNTYKWSDWRIIFSLCASVFLSVVFLWLQFRLKGRATLPPRIILRRSVIFGFIFSCCNNGALSVVEYYLPIYLQTVKGYSAEISGVLVLPLAVGLIVSVPLAGFLTSRFGYFNPFMILNGLLTPVAVGLLTTLDADSTLWSLIVYQLLLGFGTGIGFQGPQVAVQTLFSAGDSQIGISIIQLAQGLGPAIFIAAAQSTFTSRLMIFVRRYAPGVDFAMLAKKGLKIPDVQGSEYDGIILSYIKALNATFYLPLSLACVSLIAALCMEWRSIDPKRPAKD